MSKSLGNGIDPLDLIAKYGADAVRFSLVLLTKEGQDVRLSPDRIEQGSRFCNKIWNAARFVLMNMEGEVEEVDSDSATSLEDRWILSRLARCRSKVSAWLDDYAFNDAASEMYRFVWNDFCDWYLELAKPRLLGAGAAAAAQARGTLARVLTDTLGLLHPFTPFVTEKLWESLHVALGKAAPQALISTPWPDGAGIRIDEAAEVEMSMMQETVGCVRRIRALTTLGDRRPLRALVCAPRAEERSVIERHAETIAALAVLESIEIHESVDRPAGSAVAVTGGVEVFVPLEGQADLGKLAEVLAGRAAKLRAGIDATDKKLANESFVSRADPDVVAGERERRGELVLELESIERNLEGFRAG
jgi:valyl-tRNA synthetase